MLWGHFLAVDNRVGYDGTKSMLFRFSNAICCLFIRLFLVVYADDDLCGSIYPRYEAQPLQLLHEHISNEADRSCYHSYVYSCRLSYNYNSLILPPVNYEFIEPYLGGMHVLAVLCDLQKNLCPFRKLPEDVKKPECLESDERYQMRIIIYEDNTPFARNFVRALLSI